MSSSFVIVLGVLVVAGLFGLAEDLATAADVLLWFLCAWLVVLAVKSIWIRAAAARCLSDWNRYSPTSNGKLDQWPVSLTG
jgi:hypothetical protein